MPNIGLQLYKTGGYKKFVLSEKMNAFILLVMIIILNYSIFQISSFTHM